MVLGAVRVPVPPLVAGAIEVLDRRGIGMPGVELAHRIGARPMCESQRALHS